MLSGVLAGYNVVDVKVTLYDGSYHEVDSSEMAFKIAGSMAFKEAMKKADPVILEPIMKVVVTVPEDYMGDVIGDLNARRGMIQGMDAVSGAQQITAMVPLSEMFGYATDMRSKTQGRGCLLYTSFKFEIEFLVGKKQLGKIIDKCIKVHGVPKTSEVLDAVKAQGYKYSTKSAITVAVCDATIPPQKKEIISEAEKKIDLVTDQFKNGLLSDSERYNAVLKTWEKATNDVTDALQRCV